MSPPRFVWRRITAQEFNAELRLQGVSLGKFTRLWGQNLSRARRWSNGQEDLPTWIPMALATMRIPEVRETLSVVVAAMIQEDRWHPELGDYPYKKIRGQPADLDAEDVG